LSLGYFHTPAQLAIRVGVLLERLGSHGTGERAAQCSVQRRAGVVFLFDLGHVIDASLRQLVGLWDRECQDPAGS
jgi:hypothetical protein